MLLAVRVRSSWSGFAAPRFSYFGLRFVALRLPISTLKLKAAAFRVKARMLYSRLLRHVPRQWAARRGLCSKCG